MSVLSGTFIPPTILRELDLGHTESALVERLRKCGIVVLLLQSFVFPQFLEPFDQVFAEHFKTGFPEVKDIMSNVSLTFINADPLVEFPRPITHNIIDIGGISVSSGHKPLNKTWDEIFSLRSKTVLLSFGTVAKSAFMPAQYKETIKKTIRKFPDVTFIWKYEMPEHQISDGIPNLVESTFVPQNDMLYDPRLSLFITHCGQGSTVEATTAGVPLIVIPVLGDQKRNSQVIKRLDTGIILENEQLNGSDALEVALKEIFSNPEPPNNFADTTSLPARSDVAPALVTGRTPARTASFSGVLRPSVTPPRATPVVSDADFANSARYTAMILGGPPSPMNLLTSGTRSSFTGISQGIVPVRVEQFERAATMSMTPVVTNNKKSSPTISGPRTRRDSPKESEKESKDPGAIGDGDGTTTTDPCATYVIRRHEREDSV